MIIVIISVIKLKTFFLLVEGITAIGTGEVITHTQSQSRTSHSLHILGLDGSNADSSAATPFCLSVALTEKTFSKSPPSTRLWTCSSTTKNGSFASAYSAASMGGGGGTMCVTFSQLAGSRLCMLTKRAASVFQMCGGLRSRYMSWTECKISRSTKKIRVEIVPLNLSKTWKGWTYLVFRQPPNPWLSGLLSLP